MNELPIDVVKTILHYVGNTLNVQLVGKLYWERSLTGLTKINLRKVVEDGNLPFLIWVFKSIGNEVFKKYFVILYAFLHQQSHIIKFASENLCASSWMPEITYYAATHNHVDWLDLLGNLQIAYLEWHPNTVLCAIQNGHIEFAKRACQLGCPWANDITAIAASGGHFEFIKWAHTHAQSNGFCWSEHTTSHAAQSGRLDIIQWCFAHGCPWNSEYTTSKAAFRGDLNVLTWVIQHGCPWSKYTTAEAAIKGQTQVLEWCISKGCPWSPDTTSSAVCYGSLDMLVWMVDNGAPWCPSTTSQAAIYGRLDIIEWAVTSGCPWSPFTMTHAQFHNHHHVIEWALENGFNFA